jgi:hypothetical protein
MNFRINLEAQSKSQLIRIVFAQQILSLITKISE